MDVAEWKNKKMVLNQRECITLKVLPLLLVGMWAIWALRMVGSH